MENCLRILILFLHHHAISRLGPPNLVSEVSVAWGRHDVEMTAYRIVSRSRVLVRVRDVPFTGIAVRAMRRTVTSGIS